MNAEQLKPFEGQLVRLDPAPIWLDQDDHIVATPDENWKIEKVEHDGAWISCPGERMSKKLGYDNIEGCRTPGVLFLQCHLFIKGRSIQIKPIVVRR